MSDNQESTQGADNLAPYPIKQEIKFEDFKKFAEALSGVEKNGNGAVYFPTEAIAEGVRMGNAFVQMFKIVVMCLTKGILMPVELLLRRQIGERYFNLTTFTGFILLCLIAWQKMRIDDDRCIWFATGTVALLVVRRVITYKRDRKGHYWHSYSEGASIIRIPPLDSFFAARNFTFDLSKIVFEPVALAVLGLVFMGTTEEYFYVLSDQQHMSVLTFYLWVAAGVSFLYQLYCYNVRKNMLLDEKDAQVLAEVREKLRSSSDTPGMFIHKGIAYSVLGGEKKEEPTKDCPNPDI